MPRITRILVWGDGKGAVLVLRTSEICVTYSESSRIDVVLASVYSVERDAARIDVGHVAKVFGHRIW